MGLRATIQRAREELIRAGVDTEEARLDVELLARRALGWDRATLVARLADEPPPSFQSAFQPLLERRLRREPMAYILEVQEFWGRDFQVAAGVLIPRPETELLIEEALAWASEQDAVQPLRVADIGTGSGCLAITIALEVPRAIVHATDISSAALAMAHFNADRLGATVRLHSGALLSEVPTPLDLIVSNPPYVARADYLGLQPEVRAFEPESALVAGDDGLTVIRELVSAAGAALRPGGRLLMEIGYGQDEAVAHLMRSRPDLDLLRIRRDLQGIPRAVVAARGPRAATSSGSAVSVRGG
jgi:release factor glutamine methyltransferase